MMLWQRQWVEWRRLGAPHTLRLPGVSVHVIFRPGVGQLSTIWQDQPGCPAKAGWVLAPRCPPPRPGPAAPVCGQPISSGAAQSSEEVWLSLSR